MARQVLAKRQVMNKLELTPIRDESDVARGVVALLSADPRLRPVHAVARAVPLRLSPPGFASLVSIIVSQQVSRASADAIYGRLARLVDPLDAEGLSRADDALYRTAGLSRPKQRTLDAVSRAVLDGLDLDAICTLPPDEAMRRLTAVHGIGEWTAQIYLLFCAGHPDIFPARDIALQVAVGHALGHEARPGERAVAAIAESWAPWRGVAARLFWSYYAALKGRDAATIAAEPQNP